MSTKGPCSRESSIIQLKATLNYEIPYLSSFSSIVETRVNNECMNLITLHLSDVLPLQLDSHRSLLSISRALEHTNDSLEESS